MSLSLSVSVCLFEDTLFEVEGTTQTETNPVLRSSAMLTPPQMLLGQPTHISSQTSRTTTYSMKSMLKIWVSSVS